MHVPLIFGLFVGFTELSPIFFDGQLSGTLEDARRDQETRPMCIKIINDFEAPGVKRSAGTSINSNPAPAPSLPRTVLGSVFKTLCNA
ncbi:hypothetical protein F5879DRAFT_79903 [Lentinula edodes]|nr:hypothetical protein F5879DRAFT_79903 [Lentinula edodes]